MDKKCKSYSQFINELKSASIGTTYRNVINLVIKKSKDTTGLEEYKKILKEHIYMKDNELHYRFDDKKDSFSLQLMMIILSEEGSQSGFFPTGYFQRTRKVRRNNLSRLGKSIVDNIYGELKGEKDKKDNASASNTGNDINTKVKETGTTKVEKPKNESSARDDKHGTDNDNSRIVGDLPFLNNSNHKLKSSLAHYKLEGEGEPVINSAERLTINKLKLLLVRPTGN